MGRELRRKQAKKEGKSLEKENNKESNQIKSLIIITSVVVIIICLIYVLSALFITKELDWFKKEETNKELISNSILASSIFKQTDSEYYVYFYDFSNEDTSLTSRIKSAAGNIKVYNVDTSSALNGKYVNEEKTNSKATSLEELQVKNPTLIKISNDKIVNYYEEASLEKFLEK